LVLGYASGAISELTVEIKEWYLYLRCYMSTNKVYKDIFLFINSLPPSAAEAVRKLEKINAKKYRILLLLDTRSKIKSPHGELADIVIDCDYSKPSKIGLALLPHQKDLLAVTCRSESNIARFIQVIPEVPFLRTPSTESLLWASDKYEMRKRFRLHDPKHTPRFALISANTIKERHRIIEKVRFPMVIKPTNLAASALVSICYHEEELEKTLSKAFRTVRSIYKNDNRLEVPKMMAEEYMEGEMYSVDSYVNSRGAITHCPMVKVVTGKNIGHDDFYNYLRITPTNLKAASIELAHERVEIGIKALGLKNTTTHTELLLIDGEWKIIEIGPRIGGFRPVLHNLSCDIDHSLNDLLTRIPQKPVVGKKCKGFAAMMRFYADKEGYIESISGIKKTRKLASTEALVVKLKIGDRALFAKNGGRGVFDLTLFSTDRSKLLADIRRVEKMVEVKVATKGAAKKAVGAKKPAEIVGKNKG
jgi:biotin carboxylase